MVTVLTPTYNRADLLPNLYGSLVVQSCGDFEWVIVDDGSADDTAETVKRFSEEGKLKIRYFRQENSGVHIALDNGYRYAAGELILAVADDDTLLPNALALIGEKWAALGDRSRLAGISFRKIDLDAKRAIGRTLAEDGVESDPVEIVYRYGIVGDKAEVLRADVLRQYPFPRLRGEKYFPVGYQFARIGEKYKIAYYNDVIYACRYLDTGLSRTLGKRMRKMPSGYRHYYAYMTGRKGVPFLYRVKFLLRTIQCFRYEALRKA
ncbi:MAG: glycosyltransferase family A protein [Rectinemataceae bacterium]